jgi:Ni,Fe-hydrogenase maturation factor
MGAHLPTDEDIVLIGIEAVNVLTFDASCTPEVEAAIPRAVEAVVAALERQGEA